MPSNDELKVFISSREGSCDACGEPLEGEGGIFLTHDQRVLCLACADLDHLVFLPSGDAALTRRSRKHSPLSAVVLKWSKARKRYERQGLLVSEQALETAEQECLADAEVRKRQRARAARKREVLDQQFVAEFAAMIRAHYPACPPRREVEIAEHACRKYSGRIGRGQAARNGDSESVRLAVRAHVRHAETHYDELLGSGIARAEARRAVEAEIERTLQAWEGTS